MSPPPATATTLALDVTITAGPNTGTRVRFAAPPVAFGRDGAHPLVIDLPVVSRDHGFFDIRDGKWVVVNRSPNGLRLNGKKLTGKKSRALPASADIIIGDQAVMALRLREVGTEESTETADQNDADPMHRPRRKVTRTRLLMGLVGFWVVLFGVLFALEPMLDRGEAGSTVAALPVPRLDAAAIDALVRAAPRARADNDLLAEEALKQADAFYALRDVKPDAAYRAMEAYRRAASYLPGNTLADPLAQRRYLDLQQQLVDDITARYADAMGKLDSRRYDAAARAFDELLARFPDHDRGDDSLHRHLLKLRDYARRQIQ